MTIIATSLFHGFPQSTVGRTRLKDVFDLIGTQTIRQNASGRHGIDIGMTQNQSVAIIRARATIL
jgi:hypothetical protein